MALKIPKAAQGALTPSHARAKKQELEAAKRLLVRGSGCGSVKGDVRLKGITRLECKTTKHKSFALSRELVERIESAAMGAGEVPAFEIEFCSEDGVKELSCLVMPTWVLNEYLNNQNDVPRN